MNRKIKKAGVIGAGVMGATIAAHFANAGIETILLDMVLPELADADKKFFSIWYCPSWPMRIRVRA